MKRILSVVTVICIIMVSLTACFAAKTDEELISDRIDSFMKAYNSGDMDGVLESLSAKTRNTMSAILSIGNSLIGDLTGIGLSLSDMFGLGVGLQAGDLLTLSDVDIDIQSEKKAIAEATMSYVDVMGGFSSKVSFIMVKEGNDWFIEDMR